MCAGAKSWIVNFVNPKFQNLSKPLLVAILVGFTTLGLVVGISIINLKDCTKQTQVLSALSVPDLISEVSCIEYSALLVTDGAFLTRRECMINHDQEYTIPDVYNEEKKFSAKYCTTEESYNYLDENQASWSNSPAPHCFTSPTGTQPVYSNLNELTPDKMVLYDASWNQGAFMSISYKECPSFFVAVGSALGFATYIEFVMTLIILGILMCTGVVSRDLSALRSILEEQAKNTISTVAAEAVGEDVAEFVTDRQEKAEEEIEMSEKNV